MSKNTTGLIAHTKALTADELLKMSDSDIAYDDENPNTTEADWDGAVIKHNGQVVGTVRTRGAQKTPRKVVTSIRLSPDVVEYFKATGSGWQTRVDEALRDYVLSHPVKLS